MKAGGHIIPRESDNAQASIIQALRDAFLAAQLGDAVIAAQAFQHDADLVLGREMAPRLPPDVLHHLLHRGLRRRFCIGGSGLHLRSFVTMTKPRSSLHHHLKSVPSALTADIAEATLRAIACQLNCCRYLATAIR